LRCSIRSSITCNLERHLAVIRSTFSYSEIQYNLISFKHYLKSYSNGE
jgi:hypothetical protein